MLSILVCGLSSSMLFSSELPMIVQMASARSRAFPGGPAGETDSRLRLFRSFQQAVAALAVRHGFLRFQSIHGQQAPCQVAGAGKRLDFLGKRRRGLLHRACRMPQLLQRQAATAQLSAVRP
jgi:hypothetical protein